MVAQASRNVNFQRRTGSTHELAAPGIAVTHDTANDSPSLPGKEARGCGPTSAGRRSRWLPQVSRSDECCGTKYETVFLRGRHGEPAMAVSPPGSLIFMAIDNKHGHRVPSAAVPPGDGVHSVGASCRCYPRTVLRSRPGRRYRRPLQFVARREPGRPGRPRSGRRCSPGPPHSHPRR